MKEMKKELNILRLKTIAYGSLVALKAIWLAIAAILSFTIGLLIMSAQFAPPFLLIRMLENDTNWIEFEDIFVLIEDAFERLVDTIDDLKDISIDKKELKKKIKEAKKIIQETKVEINQEKEETPAEVKPTKKKNAKKDEILERVRLLLVKTESLTEEEKKAFVPRIKEVLFTYSSSYKELLNTISQDESIDLDNLTLLQQTTLEKLDVIETAIDSRLPLQKTTLKGRVLSLINNIKKTI